MNRLKKKSRLLNVPFTNAQSVVAIQTARFLRMTDAEVQDFFRNCVIYDEGNIVAHNEENLNRSAVPVPRTLNKLSIRYSNKTLEKALNLPWPATATAVPQPPPIRNNAPLSMTVNSGRSAPAIRKGEIMKHNSLSRMTRVMDFVLNIGLVIQLIERILQGK